MEDEIQSPQEVSKELEQPIEPVPQDPLELISEQFIKVDEDIMKNRRHTKALYEEIKQLKSTVKLLIEEVQSLE